jgi:hypothetical protein
MCIEYDWFRSAYENRILVFGGIGKGYKIQ